jgi:Pyruvate/2-oxoacid:ferredoxin oxidoreductase delta subunit
MEGSMRKLLGPLLGALVLSVMAYSAWLTADAGSVISCLPAILVIVAVVGGLVTGVTFFGTVEARPVEAVKLQPALQVAALRPRRVPAPQTDARPIYNERKIRDVMAGLGEIPAKYTHKRKRPRQVAQVLEPACTGCGLCIPFCPTDCIEVEARGRWPNSSAAPVRVRYDECIGCGICVGVCSTLAWDATVMRDTDDIELEEGIVIHDTFSGDLDRFPTGF